MTNQRRKFGKYRLIAHLATGGMAEIYLASASSLAGFEKLIVIKRILPNLAREKVFIEMFLDEARIAARLNHPNVIQIFDLGLIDGMYFIAMEYLPGESLSMIVKTCIERKKRLPMHLAAGIVMQAAEGLHHAHSMLGTDGKCLNIVHRDVSPQNIFVLYDGGVKVVDFGIANATFKNNNTRTGTLKGKYSYMSPEQILSKQLDGRSDVFSLGVVLWECLVGRKLFRQESDLELLQAIVQKDAPSPRRFLPSMPEELEKIVLKVLSRNRESRYQTSADFRNELSRFLKNTEQEADTMAIAHFMQDVFAERITKMRSLIENAQSSTSSDLSDSIVGDIRHYMPDTEASMPRTGPSLHQSSMHRQSSKLLFFTMLLACSVAFILFGFYLFSAEFNTINENALDPSREKGSLKESNSSIPIASLGISANASAPQSPAATESMSETSSTETSSKASAPDLAPSKRRDADSKTTRDKEQKKQKPWFAKNRPNRRKSNKTNHRTGKPRRTSRPAQTTLASLKPQTAPPGTLRLITVPWTDIYYKGRKIGQTPLIDVEFPSGRINLHAINKESGIDKQFTVTIEPGKSVKKRFNFF